VRVHPMTGYKKNDEKPHPNETQFQNSVHIYLFAQIKINHSSIYIFISFSKKVNACEYRYNLPYSLVPTQIKLSNILLFVLIFDFSVSYQCVVRCHSLYEHKNKVRKKPHACARRR